MVGANSSDGLLCQEGHVTRVENNRVYVRVEKPRSCAGCASQGLCEASSYGKQEIEIKYEGDISIGRRVELGVRPKALVAASFLLFIVPMLAFIAGVFLGYLFSAWLDLRGQQWYGLVMGVVFLSTVFLLIKVFSPRFERSGKYEPVITKILD